jgi:K+/H+ antiporter YhaU regulatory subunit KhtT
VSGLSKQVRVESSAYQRIAIDLAQKIANQFYAEGQRLHGRSTLAANYKVSPETIRKAIYLLKDVGILNTKKGSGIEVLSAEKAAQFVERHQQIAAIGDIKGDLLNFSQTIRRETTAIYDKLKLLIDTTERFKDSNPLMPFELVVPRGSPAIGKTVSELNFWHNTGATVVAIQRGDHFILSPGPYATFYETDVFFILGNDMAFLAAKKLLAPEKPPAEG